MRKVKVVPVKSDIHIDTSQIPDSVAMNLAQVVLHAIQEAYADPAVQEDYQRWKAAQESNQKKNRRKKSKEDR